MATTIHIKGSHHLKLIPIIEAVVSAFFEVGLHALSLQFLLHTNAISSTELPCWSRQHLQKKKTYPELTSTFTTFHEPCDLL